MPARDNTDNAFDMVSSPCPRDGRGASLPRAWAASVNCSTTPGPAVQAPLVEIPIGTISYLLRSMAPRTLLADRMLMSCSLEVPPKMTPSLSFPVMTYSRPGPEAAAENGQSIRAGDAEHSKFLAVRLRRWTKRQ